MLILLNIVLVLSLSLPISTVKTDFDIIQMQHHGGSQFYVLTQNGIILYDIRDRRILQEYRSNYGNIVGKGYMDMPRRAVIPTSAGIVEYHQLNMIINQKYINVQADVIYHSNNHFYAIDRRDRGIQLTILDNNLNNISSFEILGKIIDVFANNKYISLHTTEGLYIITGNQTVFIGKSELYPSNRVWFGEDMIFIPYYQQLFVLDLQGDVKEIRYFNTSILSVFQTGPKDYYVHTINSIYTRNGMINIDGPISSVRYYLNSSMVLLRDGTSTTLVMNGIPVGRYEFDIAENMFYLPIQKVFVVSENQSINIYSAASCYFHRRTYVDYCRDIDINYSYFISPPVVMLENSTLTSNRISWGSLEPRAYLLKCISDYEGDYSVGQSDSVDLVILDKGKLNRIDVIIQDQRYPDNFVEMVVGETIKVELRDYRGRSMAADAEIYRNGELQNRITINGVISFDFNNPGEYVIRISKQCYEPVELYILVRSQGIDFGFVGIVIVIFILIIALVYIFGMRSK
ncbi:MAG: hypothetical protein N3C61_01865 [Candidatus Micrarchaeota archaeon]|nr:hypothetical protein [Candidatus Micrarchaeota archaeon]